MERNTVFCNLGLYIKSVLVFILLLGGSGSAWADELTVNSENQKTIQQVPVYGNLCGSDGTLPHSEFIIASKDLSVMNGKNITSMTFYINNSNDYNWGSAEFDVFLKEINDTVFSSAKFYGETEASIVYHGSLSITKGKMVVNFPTSNYYTYGGSNLLIGIYCTQKGESTDNYAFYFNGYAHPTLQWGTYYCVYYASSTATTPSRGNVKPKTTFTYEEPVTATLTITPDDDADFGSVWQNTTKTNYYTVTNNSEATVLVNAEIGGDDPSFFSISPSEPQSLESGEEQTYSITYTHNNTSLGSKSATVTFTPGDDSENAIIKSITANAVSNNAPQLSVTPDDDTNLGTVYSGETTYTVTNTGTGQLTVEIASNNSDFVVSGSRIENLGNGESGSFTVTYTFGNTAEKLGVNSADITITPTYDASKAKTYQVSATSNATFTLDENNASSPGYGTKDYLLVKYTPSSGWNTISMPFTLRYNTIDNMTPIFGEGWKAYTLSSYSNGTLTFSKVSESAVISNGKPYLVYIENAANHPSGVLFPNGIISTQGNTPGSTTTGTATFQGIYATKTYVENDNWYGVTSSGKIMKAAEGAFVRGYRAYFTGISAPSNGARITIVFEDEEGTTTDLEFVKMVDPEAEHIYTLSGQKVQKGKKGIYIVNGRKVVIK